MGTKTRSVRCINTTSTPEKFVDDQFCMVLQSIKPVSTANCNEPCRVSHEWNVGPFGECDVTTCKKHRAVVCQQNDTGDIVEDNNCRVELRPLHVEACCQFKWRAKWTPVSIYVR